MIALEPNPPGAVRQAQMRRELASRFGYGENPYMVNRYIKMIDWSVDFEEHLVNDKRYDTFAVKHQANRYFQYFEELAKGTNPGGVAHTLGQNEPFKHLVYDLLFQNKFKNWTIVRNLKYYNSDVHEALTKARDMADVEEAQDVVEEKLSEARAQQREQRVGNPNQRIEVFANWLEQLPISAFRDQIRPDNLRLLRSALRLVDVQIAALNIGE